MHPFFLSLQMVLTLVSETPLPLPSASGIELVDGTAYVIADDAPTLFAVPQAALDAGQPIALATVRRIPLFTPPAAEAPVRGRLPKVTKPDLEAIARIPAAALPPGAAPTLLLLGSGSLPGRRERGFWVVLPPAGPAQVREVALAPLYAAVRAALPAGVALNIEAAATTHSALLLYQRGLGAGGQARSYQITLPLESVLACLLTGTPAPAVQEVRSYALPQVQGAAAGLSGASWYDGRCWVSASVETTLDPVLDGAVLGSFVGTLPSDDDHSPETPLPLRPLVWPDGRTYTGKVEGLAVRRQHPDGTFDLLLVTDDDHGGSTLLAVRAQPNHVER